MMPQAHWTLGGLGPGALQGPSPLFKKLIQAINWV